MLLTKIYQRLKTHTVRREISQAFHIKYNDFLERRGALTNFKDLVELLFILCEIKPGTAIVNRIT